MSCSYRPKVHKYYHQRVCKTYPPEIPVPDPKPEPKHIGIPVMKFDDLPSSDAVPNGTMFLTGPPLNCNDPAPNPKDYYLIVSNGCYYIGFSPNMIAT